MGSFNAMDQSLIGLVAASLQYLNVMKSYDAGQSFNQAIISNSASPFGEIQRHLSLHLYWQLQTPSVIYAGWDSLSEAMMADRSFTIRAINNWIMEILPWASYRHRISMKMVCTYVWLRSDSCQMHVLLSTDGGVTLLDRSSESAKQISAWSGSRSIRQ